MTPEMMTDWPIWLVASLLILNLFREQIGAFFPVAIREHFSSRAKQAADKREHEQEIEEVKLDNQIQTSAAAELRKSWREENLMAIVQSKDEFEHDMFKELTTSFRAITQEIHNLHLAQIRTNDLLTNLNITMTRFSDALLGGTK